MKTFRIHIFKTVREILRSAKSGLHIEHTISVETFTWTPLVETFYHNDLHMDQ